MKKIILVITVVLVQITACKKSSELTLYPVDPVIPSERPFYMGFTAFPYDTSLAAQKQSYTNQKENGDILLIHFDHGVPWTEALNNLPFPAEVQRAVDEAVANKTQNHKVLLTATATDTDREHLANYWNNSGTHQPLPPFWQNKPFNSPDVIAAYKNYCHRIIDAVQPDYFAYGIEINGSFKNNSQPFNDYLEFANCIYSDLKSSYPDIPVILTFQDQSFNKSKEELLEVTTKLLTYSDMIAVSTYPFWQYDYPKRDANPELFPNTWLKEMRELAPDKPFGVSETGFCAEDLTLPDYDIHIKGNAQWQNEYVQKLLAEANRVNAEFVLWFIYRDYDLLEQHLPKTNEVLKIWRDNGLEDGNGNPRPSLTVWKEWLMLKVKKEN